MNIQKLVFIQVIILSLQILLYFGSERFQKNPHNVERPVDKFIPVIPAFTLIYVLWFPLIFLFPIHLYQASEEFYKVYLMAWLLIIAISIPIYLIYPTSFARPKNVESLPLGWTLKVIYKYSYKGLNCMPSMHCSISTLVLLASIFCLGMPLLLRIIYGLISFGIIVSTQFTKQHVLIDMVTGVFLGTFCYGFAWIGYLLIF